MTLNAPDPKNQTPNKAYERMTRRWNHSRARHSSHRENQGDSAKKEQNTKKGGDKQMTFLWL